MTKTTYFSSIQAKNNEITLVPFGDVHRGFPSVETKETLEALQDLQQWVLKTPNVYVLGMGDYMENSTRTSVGTGVYDQLMTPAEQFEVATEYLKPIADAGLLLGLLTGNHEERTRKASGIDPSKQMASLLSVPYYQYSAYIRVQFPGCKHSHKIYAEHGSGGASLTRTRMAKAEKLARTADADIYLMGHVHDLFAWEVPLERFDFRNKRIVTVPQYFGLTGHWLERKGSYAEMMSYPPTRPGYMKIHIRPDLTETEFELIRI